MTSLRFYYPKLVVYTTLDGWHFTVFRFRELDGGGNIGARLYLLLTLVISADL